MIVPKKSIGLIVLLFMPYSFRKQHRLSFVRKEQGLTRGISPNAVKMQKFDPYKKKFTDLRIIETIGSHIRR